MTQMPAVAMVAVPGRRKKMLDIAREIEAKGFSGIFAPSFGDCIGLCQAIGSVTNRVEFGTAIQPIYFREPAELARSASFIHELSDGRFRLGIGVSHGPVHKMMNLTVGKPLSDTREYVAAMRAAEAQTGPLPPITLATLRDKMLGLSAEIAEGAIWANGARSHMKTQLAKIDVSDDFYKGDMVPTVISDDKEAAANVCRKTLMGYIALPNYRNYWKAAGYEQEMTDIEKAFEDKAHDKLPGLMTDKWLSDVTLYGTASEVREGVEAWFDAGIKSPILVPSSAAGGQMKAYEELFAAYS